MRALMLLLAWLGATAASAQDLVIRGATLVNPGEAPVRDSVIVIRDGRIVAVGRAGRVRMPRGVEILEAAGKWITPGYVDSHVHFFQSGGLYARPDGIDLRAARPYEAEIAAIQADLDETFARYLASGITAVADVGGQMGNFAVRERSAAEPRAPRVAVAGPLISTWRPPVLSDVADPPIIAAASAEEARALVRAQIPHRPDFIKIWYVVLPGQTAEAFLPIVVAAIEEAHRANIRVAVHATELETARAALRAGADILVHGVEDKPVDADFIALLRQRRAIYSTTLDVYSGYMRTFTGRNGFTEREYALADPDVMGTLTDLRHLPDGVAPDWTRRLAGTAVPEQPLAMLIANLRNVHQAGIPIAMGTDAGNIGTLPGPSIYREMALMAQAGMSPAEILTSATQIGALLMGRNDIGLVERGRLADLVLLDADPLADVANLARIATVVKGGRAFTPGELVPDDPVQIVQRQLNAYNQRNLDAFLATYHPDAKLYDFPDRPTMAGHSAMRETYGPMFAQLTQLHAQVPRRITMGNFVIDEEIVSGLPGGAVFRATAIYEVTNGLISRVWFIEGGPVSAPVPESGSAPAEPERD